MSEQHDSDTVPHQDEVEGVIDERLVDASAQGVIADLPAAASVEYVQAEVTALNTKVNLVLGVLRDAGLIPTT